MEIFKHFGIDVGKDTLEQIFNKMDEKGLGSFSVVLRDKDDSPKGMLLMLKDAEAIPYVERALEAYEADTEGNQ